MRLIVTELRDDMVLSYNNSNNQYNNSGSEDEEENDKCESLSASLSRVHFSAHFIQSIMESDYLLSSSPPTNFSLPFDFIK